MAKDLNTADEAAYRKFFEEIDQDKNGKIDFNEFDDLIKALNQSYPADTLRDIFSQADRDGDNRIDFDEFVRIVPNLPPITDIFQRRFREHDLNGDGFLTKEELQFAIMSMGKCVKGEDVKAMIERVDTNNDGKVDYNEFTKLIPELYKTSS